jgi:uncharacterized protein (DUF1015 family)
MSSDEARQMAEGNPLSFLRVSKPEIELPAGIDVHSPEVYSRGKQNFGKLIASGALRQDAKPCFYLYRQIMGSHSQTGLVSVASCEDYLAGIVRKHEFTRPDKEDDRVRHIETLNAQSGPVFLVRKAVPALEEFLTARTRTQPDIDFTAADGIQHTSWSITQDADIQFIQQEIARLPILYIADGHHRCAAAGRVFEARKSAGNSGWFLNVMFPHTQVKILPYNRAIKDLNGLSLPELQKKLTSAILITADGKPTPPGTHHISFYAAGKWQSMQFRPELTASGSAIDKLDVELLQKHVLGPIFGIDDPRRSERISFVGGIRGTAELEKLVNSGEYACAFSMFPTSIEELMAVADDNGIMPPKSTWFEPKLRDAMFCHMLD